MALEDDRACTSYGCPAQSAPEEWPFRSYPLKVLATLLVATNNLAAGWVATGHGHSYLASSTGSREAINRLASLPQLPDISMRMADASANDLDLERGPRKYKQELMGCVDRLKALNVGASQRRSWTSKREFLTKATLAAAVLCTPGAGRAVNAAPNEPKLLPKQQKIVDSMGGFQRQLMFNELCAEGTGKEVDDNFTAITDCFSLPQRAYMQPLQEDEAVLIRQDQEMLFGKVKEKPAAKGAPKGKSTPTIQPMRIGEKINMKGTGGVLWNSEIALTRFMEAQGDYLGAKIVELGCGTALASIQSVKLGVKSVIASDVDPKALQLAKQNAVDNLDSDEMKSFSTAVYRFGDPLPKDWINANVVIASEVTYDRKLWPELLKTFKQFKRATLLISCEFRREEEGKAWFQFLQQNGYNIFFKKSPIEKGYGAATYILQCYSERLIRDAANATSPTAPSSTS